MTLRQSQSGLWTPETPGRTTKPRRLRCPEVNTPVGAVLYATLGSLVFWFLANLLSHIHVTWR